MQQASARGVLQDQHMVLGLCAAYQKKSIGAILLSGGVVTNVLRDNLGIVQHKLTASYPCFKHAAATPIGFYRIGLRCKSLAAVRAL